MMKFFVAVLLVGLCGMAFALVAPPPPAMNIQAHLDDVALVAKHLQESFADRKLTPQELYTLATDVVSLTKNVVDDPASAPLVTAVYSYATHAVTTHTFVGFLGAVVGAPALAFLTSKLKK
jgi:hypothetical protein